MSKRQPQPIRQYLDDLNAADYKVRRAAVKGLTRTGNPDAYPYLAAALKDGAVSVVLYAIRGLEALGDPRAIPELLALLGAAATCDMCDEVGAALVTFGKAAVPALIETLGSPSHRARAVAAKCLGQIGDRAAVDPLIGLLNDPHPWPLTAVLAVLRSFRDERAREPLAELLTRPESAVPSDESVSAYEQKRGAAFALADFGDPRAIDVLAQSFSAERRMCVETIRQLGKIADPRVRPLIQQYIDDDPESLCASQARATLEQIAAREC